MNALKEALLLVSHSLTETQLIEIERRILQGKVTLEEIMVKIETCKLEHA